MLKPPDYRIIYNWDGAPHGYSEHLQTMEQFLGHQVALLGRIFNQIEEHAFPNVGVVSVGVTLCSSGNPVQGVIGEILTSIPCQS